MGRCRWALGGGGGGGAPPDALLCLQHCLQKGDLQPTVTAQRCEYSGGEWGAVIPGGPPNRRGVALMAKGVKGTPFPPGGVPRTH